jgi:hypothetical protein
MLESFYRDVLPAEGNFALWNKLTKKNIWFSSQEELLEATHYAVEDEAQGVYFATATFNDQAVINGDKDARTQANVAGKKCFYLDLDAGEKKLAKHGPDKVYETQRHALADFVAFTKDTGLAPTYLISSGEGLHLYWVLGESVDVATWTATAKRLSRLFKQYGLKEDSAVTADSARILRPIGTMHENGTAVRALTRRGPEYAYEGFRTAVSNLLDDEFEDAPPRRERDSSINKEVMIEGPPKSIRKIAVKCEAMADAIRARGNVEEPYWRAMLGIIKHTVEGDKAAHAFSSGHPDYDRADTQYKMDNWKTGPATCTEFSKYSKKCESCPSRGKVKSPITLGYMNDAEVEKLPEEQKPAPPAPPAPTGSPWDGAIPAGFEVKNGTLIYHMPVQRKGEDGEYHTGHETVPFTRDIFWVAQWTDAEHSDDRAGADLHKWSQGRVVAFHMDQEAAADSFSLLKFLGRMSIHTLHTTDQAKAAKAMTAYAKASLDMIKSLPARQKVNDRFGLFINESGELRCAQGEYLIEASGEISRAIVGPKLRALSDHFHIQLPYSATGKWEPSVWDTDIIPKAKRHVAYMKESYAVKGREKYQLAAMLGLASPLMAFVTGEYTRGNRLPKNGLSVSLYSQDGGRGKTAVIESAMLAYGMPSALNENRDEQGSTALGRIAELSTRGTLPIGFDEMGNTPAATYASLTSAIANGASRIRASKDGGLVVGVPWALIALFGSNKSARDMIAAASGESNAIQFRLIELDFDHQPDFSAEQQEEHKARWAAVTDCAGALGAVIHLRICQIGVAGINKLVSDCVSKAKASLKETEQAGRFQYRALGAAMALQVILKNVGLDMFEWSDLLAEFQNAHDKGISYTVENTLPSDGLALLNMALHDLTSNTAVTQDETRRTRHITKYDDPLVPVPQVVHARHIVGTRRTYVSSGALRDWCASRKVSFTKVINAARDANVIVSVYASRGDGKAQAYNLLKGMRGSTESMVSCYAFDIAALTRETGQDHSDALNLPSNVVAIPRASSEEPAEVREAESTAVSLTT